MARKSSADFYLNRAIRRGASPELVAKYKACLKPLMYPDGYKHPTGYLKAALCAPNKKGVWVVGYELEHRLVMACELHRPLTSDEEVHHIDANKTNNLVDNLEVLPSADHRRLTMKKRRQEARNKRAV